MIRQTQKKLIKYEDCSFTFRTFLLFLTHLMVQKEFFFGQIFKMEILMALYVMRDPESKNHIFSVWSVCLLSEFLKNKFLQNSQI